jgi:hypothetical protein
VGVGLVSAYAPVIIQYHEAVAWPPRQIPWGGKFGDVPVQ